MCSKNVSEAMEKLKASMEKMWGVIPAEIAEELNAIEAILNPPVAVEPPAPSPVEPETPAVPGPEASQP